MDYEKLFCGPLRKKDAKSVESPINYERLFYSLAQRHNAIFFLLEADNIDQALKICETTDEIIGNVFKKVEAEYRRQPYLLDPEQIKEEWVDKMKQRCDNPNEPKED